MSIESEITRISDNIAAAYSEAQTLGADIPAEANSNNLPGTLAAIPRATVVQGKGSDTSAVMSQAAVTNELDALVGDATSTTGRESTIMGARKYAYDLNEASKKRSIYFIEGNSTEAGVWTGTCEDITEYYDGLMIAYKTNIAGATGTTLNINNMGAVAVVRNTTSAITTHYGAGSILMLTYTVDSSGTAYWKLADYDSDTKTRSSNMASKKMYIIGAQSQSTSGQTTYSNKNCYIGTDNCLYSGDNKVAVEKYGSSAISVIEYGAVGDGTTDDTTAFQNALAENRVVFVPGGTYKLSGTLLVRENCGLELSQDTVLSFTQTDADAIRMTCLASLRGNHGLIIVPYAFTASVICCDTRYDSTNHASGVPGFNTPGPQWKYGRWISDINILKNTSDGWNRSQDGTCYGTAVYLSATNDGDSTSDITYMWGVLVSGVRISGGFSYGIRAANFDSENGYTDDAWNHDMRVEAVIEACEVGVSLENCNGAHLHVTVQPNTALDGTAYAKWGVYLKDSRFVDMIGSRVWDWNASNSLWTSGGQYQHLAIVDNCRGLLLDDFLCNETSTDIRDLIYTNLTSNFDTMTVLQEPTDKWFKSVDNLPYFNDGTTNKKLMLASDKITSEQTDFVHEADGYYTSDPNFTNLVTGYTDGVYLSGGSTYSLADYTTTDYIPIDGAAVHTYRVGGEGIEFFDSYGYCRIEWYTSAKALKGSTMQTGKFDSSIYYPSTIEDDTVAAAFVTSENVAPPNGAAYFRLTAKGKGANLIVTLDEEVSYTNTWHGEPKRLDESLYAQNLMLTSPNGTNFKLTIGNDGTLSAEQI